MYLTPPLELAANIRAKIEKQWNFIKTKFIFLGVKKTKKADETEISEDTSNTLSINNYSQKDFSKIEGKC